MNYKGMDKNMQCRGFQYEVGKEYETDNAKVCECGFHACEYPLDVFSYYPPATSRYFEVEQAGEISKSDENSKVASSKIKIGAELNIAGIVKAAVEYTKSHCTEEEGNHATGDQGAASATGLQGAASATGYQGAASATGYQGAASATGYQGAASATGDQGAASATGENSVAMSCGLNGKVMGALGCALFLVERGEFDGKSYPIISVKGEIVDGKKIKPNVWYTIQNGEFVEVKDE